LITGGMIKGESVAPLAKKKPIVSWNTSIDYNSLNYDINKVWAPASRIYKIDEKGEKEIMENLYQVYVIDKKKNFIVNGEVVVAKNEEDAKFELRVSEKVRAEGLKLSDVTIIVKQLGTVSVEKEKQ